MLYYVENYDIVFYIEYLAEFCSDIEISEELKRKVLPSTEGNIPKDNMIKDLIGVCKTRYENGKPLEEIRTELESAFNYFNLNSRVALSDYWYFLEKFIISSFHSILDGNTKEEVLSIMREIINRALSLEDSLYKVSLCLSLFSVISGLRLIGELSPELISISNSMKAFDTSDVGVQTELSFIFKFYII